MKKLLALVLALVMSMSLVTISNAAFKDADKIDYKEAVDVMNAVGVFIGDEKGNFNAKENLTREQAAKIIAYLELGDKAADALVGGATFTDVASTRWSAGFVGYCAQAGVVAGVGDGKFDPAGQLTALQFGKMLLVELGYDAKAAGMVGADWAINTSKLMAKAKLMDGIDGSVNQVLTREKAAQMTLNALEAPTVEYDTKGSNITVNGAEINFGASEPSYVTNTIAKEQTISSEKLTNNGGYTIELGEKLYKNLKKIGTTDDFGRPATKWTWKSESVGTYADAADLSYTKAVKASDIYKDLNLSDTVAAKNVTVWVNGEVKTAAATDIKKSNDAKIGDVAGVNSNGNGVLTEVFYDDVADTMVITQIVTYIGEVAKTVKATDKRDAYVVIVAKAGGNGLTRPVAKGTFEYETDETFADDAFVLYTYSVKADAVKSLAVAEKVEGYVTKTINSTKDEDKNNGMTIDGTEYKMSLATAGEKLGNVSVKNDYTVYLDQYGYIIYVEQVQELGDYALVLATASKGSFIGNKAQLLLTDGTVKFVDTEENYHSGDKEIKDNTIVTFRENSDKTYTLRKVNTTLGNVNNSLFSMTNDLAGISIDGTVKAYANSASQFVVSDKKDYTTPYSDIDDWTAYTGIKNAPTVKADTGATKSVDVYYYCKSGSMVTVMFIIPNTEATVIDGSKTSLYLSKASKSDLIHDTDGDYFTYNAVVDGKIETVKVDVDAKCGAETADKLDGLYSDYTVSSKGYITGLTKYGPYSTGETKTALDGVVGIDKTSKEYTVKLELQAGDTYQYTITCADDMKVFYVDKDGNITESSYAAIYPDNNDLVYAVVDKYLVKTLVIFEVEDPTTGSTTATYNFTAGDATVSTQNNASYWLANVQVKKAAFVPNTATLNLTYDVYLDGMLYKANQTTAPTGFPATQSVVTLSGTGFFADSKVEVVVKDLTTDKVAVRYLDADNNKEIPASDFVSKTDTANVGTKSAIPFQLKTGKIGDVTYEVYQGTTKLWTGSPNAVDASRAGMNSVADWTGNNFVDVKIIGMSALTTPPATYSFTNNTTTAGFTTGVTGETAKVQVTASNATGKAYNTQLSATIALTDTPAVTTNFGYKVECSKLGVSALVKDNIGVNVNFRLTKDVTITDADFTVTPVAKLAVTSAAWDAGKIVLTFNHDVEAVLTAPATSLTVGASSSDINITVAIASSSADWTAVVSGNTLTVTAGTGNFAAADKIQIVTNKVVSSVTGESFNGLTTAKALSDLNTLVH